MNHRELSPEETHRLMSLMSFLSKGLMENVHAWNGDYLSKEVFIHACSAIWDVCKTAKENIASLEEQEKETIVIEPEFVKPPSDKETDHSL